MISVTHAHVHVSYAMTCELVC